MKYYFFFCREIHYDKGLSISGDSPGFLFSWWSVFWDLYSSAPERRQHNLHSDEAKAFHEYNFLNVNGQQQQQQQQNNGQMYMNGMQHVNFNIKLIWSAFFTNYFIISFCLEFKCP